MRSSEFIHPSLVKYAGSEATIVGLPSHPITWYTVKFHDGKEVKLRSSSFDIIGYEAKHSTQQQFKAALAKQQQHMEQLRAAQQQHQQQHHQQHQAMMAASHSAMTSATSSSAASSVPSPVPHQLLNHSQAMSHNGTGSQQVHSAHHSPHPINTASMLPPMSAQAAAAATMQHHQQHAAQQQAHKAQVKQAIKKEPKVEMMNGAVAAVTAAAVPAHATSMNGSSNPQLTLNIPHHMNGTSSNSTSASTASSQQQQQHNQQQQPKMAAPVNPLAMNPLFSALSSLQSSFNPSPAAAAAMPFLSPFALQSFFAQATPYDAAIMAAALRANGFPIPMSTMTGLAAMQQMAAQAQVANQQQQQHQQQQQQAAVVVPHLTIPHQPQHNGNANNHNNSNNHNNNPNNHNSQPAQPTFNNNHHNTVSATSQQSSYNNTKHSRPNSGASMNGSSHHTLNPNHNNPSNTQPTITITPTASSTANQPGSFSIHSALPSPLASPLHLNTTDILPSPRLPMPDLFFSPPPTSTSLSHSLSMGNQFSLPSSFLHPFSNPPSALTSPTAHTPIVPFDGVIGDISSPHGTMLATAPHTSTHHGHNHINNKRGQDDLLSATHGHNGRLGMAVDGGRLGVAVDSMGLGMGLGMGMGVGAGGGYDSVEMLLPLFTPTNASFERLLADTDNKQDNNKRMRID